MAGTSCGQCGATVPRNHQFCGRCGASARAATGARLSGAPTRFFSPLQTPGRAKLIVIKGEGGDGVSYALNATEHVAGREGGVILFPDDEYLSREHANFRYHDAKLYLTDLGSLNGTYLRIHEPHHLTDGDLFSCGQQVLRVDILDGARDYPAPDHTLLYVSPDRKSRLRVVQIVDDGREGRIASSAVGELTVGREACDLNVPDDAHLSRRHAKLSLERDGRILLSDLGSKNGTFVRIKGEVQLVHGDYVFMGRELLRVEIVE